MMLLKLRKGLWGVDSQQYYHAEGLKLDEDWLIKTKQNKTSPWKKEVIVEEHSFKQVFEMEAIFQESWEGKVETKQKFTMVLRFFKILINDFGFK